MPALNGSLSGPSQSKRAAEWGLGRGSNGSLNGSINGSLNGSVVGAAVGGGTQLRDQRTISGGSLGSSECGRSVTIETDLEVGKQLRREIKREQRGGNGGGGGGGGGGGSGVRARLASKATGMTVMTNGGPRGGVVQNIGEGDQLLLGAGYPSPLGRRGSGGGADEPLTPLGSLRSPSGSFRATHQTSTGDSGTDFGMSFKPSFSSLAPPAPPKPSSSLLDHDRGDRAALVLTASDSVISGR